MYPITEISLKLQEINFQGNVIPASWKNHLKLNNRIDLNSMYILSEIIYWYRPIILRDDLGQENYFQKFKSDFLQKSYSQLESSLGLTKKQIQDSLDRLEKSGLVKRHFRTIQVQIPGTTDVRPLNNVMYIEIFPEKIKEITYSDLKKVIPYTPTGGEGSTYKSIGVSPQVSTYTENTPKNTTKNNIVCCDPPVASPHLKNSVEILYPDGKKEKISKEDIFTIAVQKRADWKVDEIEKAWQVLSKYKNPVRDIYLFINGTIKNFRKSEKSEFLSKKENKFSKNKTKQEQEISSSEYKVPKKPFVAPGRNIKVKYNT